MSYDRRKTFPLIPMRRVAGLPFGSMSSQRRGTGSEIADVREYRPGDNPRKIDFRASAKLSAARNTDVFVVRDYYADESVGVVLFVDRRPSMAAFSVGFPGSWFNKDQALITAGTMIVNSAVEASCPVGYLDYARYAYPDPRYRLTESFWRPPNQETEARRVRERNLIYPTDPAHFDPPAFFAPEDNLSMGFRQFQEQKRSIPKGSFVFILSDFLVIPDEELWEETLALGWDIIPVVLQDPVWERSFPDVSGITLPMRDPATQRTSRVRFNEREIDLRRSENETRFANLVVLFERLGCDFVVPQGHDEETIHQAFREWARYRSSNRRVRR